MNKNTKSKNKNKSIIFLLWLWFLIPISFCIFNFFIKIDIFYSMILSIFIFYFSGKTLAINSSNFETNFNKLKDTSFRLFVFLPSKALSLLLTTIIIIKWDTIINYLEQEILVLKNRVNFIFGEGALTFFETVFHLTISFILVFIFIFVVIYWKAIINSIKAFWEKDIILKVVTRDFVNDVLNAQSSVSYNFGIKEIINGLSAKGVHLKTNHFVKLLGISANLKPDVVYGCWNTTWYNLNEIFKLIPSGHKMDIAINEKWKSYFDNLEKVYKDNKGNKHKRIFIVNDTKQILNFLNNINIKKNINDDDSLYWFYLLQRHLEWKIKDIYLIEKEELEQQINDQINTDIPNWRDFAIFEKKYFCVFKFCFMKKLWAFAQETKSANDENSFVIYKSGKVVKNVYNFFFEDNNNRWKTKIHLQFDFDKKKLYKK